LSKGCSEKKNKKKGQKLSDKLERSHKTTDGTELISHGSAQPVQAGV
jgi:hypothetical protein